MKNQPKQLFVLLLPMLVFCYSGVVSAQSKAEKDKGESKEYTILKNRRTAPKESEIDNAVTLDSLLNKKGPNDWSTTKGASIEGYVQQIEKEEDGDFHLVLSANPTETSTTKWVIVEITTGWRTRNRALSDAHIKNLNGKKIRVTGWLFYEPDEPSPDPRGTKWELHPVTNIIVLEK